MYALYIYVIGDLNINEYCLTDSEVAHKILENAKLAGVSSDTPKENKSFESVLKECESLDSGMKSIYTL